MSTFHNVVNSMFILIKTKHKIYTLHDRMKYVYIENKLNID